MRKSPGRAAIAPRAKEKRSRVYIALAKEQKPSVAASARLRRCWCHWRAFVTARAYWPHPLTRNLSPVYRARGCAIYPASYYSQKRNTRRRSSIPEEVARARALRSQTRAACLPLFSYLQLFRALVYLRGPRDCRVRRRVRAHIN